MRRRPVRRTRRAKRRTAWLNGMSANTCAVPLDVVRCNEEVVTPQVPALFLLAESPQPAAAAQGSISENREGTITRIVGEILLDAAFAATLTQTTWTNIVVSMGIYIADCDSLSIPLTRDPTSDVENKDWLWKGTFTHSECGIAGQTIFVCTQNDPVDGDTNSNGAHIDIRVKRKLRESEQILLSVVCAEDFLVGSEGAWEVFINGNVRVLVTTE